MKLILDFDDVLFKAKDLKAYMYRLLEEERVENVQGLYEKERAGGGVFSMKAFLRRVLNDGREGVEERVDALYGKILVKSKECINTEMLTLIEKAGKENCIIVTNGEEEWQTDKLQASGIGELVSLVYVVSGSKSECIEDLCARYSTQEIIFVDDKNDFFTAS